MKVGRLVVIVVTTALRFVLEIVPPEPQPAEPSPCPDRVEESASRSAR